MSNNDSRIHQILSHLASAANVAAGGVAEAAQSVGGLFTGRYDAVKLSIDLNRLQDEQCKLFIDIGRMMFMVKNGTVANGQEAVDSLLAQAEKIQRDIDEANRRLNDLNGRRECTQCGKAASHSDVYCASCGARLPEPTPRQADAQPLAPQDAPAEEKPADPAPKKAAKASAAKAPASATAKKAAPKRKPAAKKAPAKPAAKKPEVSDNNTMK